MKVVAIVLVCIVAFIATITVAVGMDSFHADTAAPTLVYLVLFLILVAGVQILTMRIHNRTVAIAAIILLTALFPTVRQDEQAACRAESTHEIGEFEGTQTYRYMRITTLPNAVLGIMTKYTVSCPSGFMTPQFVGPLFLTRLPQSNMLLMQFWSIITGVTIMWFYGRDLLRRAPARNDKASAEGGDKAL